MLLVRTGTVSYTHLDVYKRQEWGNLEDEMNAKMRRFTSQLNHFYKEHKALWEIDDSFDGLEIIDAVSYTHLDVYKRQSVTRSMSL